MSATRQARLLSPNANVSARGKQECDFERGVEAWELQGRSVSLVEACLEAELSDMILAWICSCKFETLLLLM